MNQSIKTITAVLTLSLGICMQAVTQDMAAANSGQTENNAFSANGANTPENTARITFSNLFPNAIQQKWSNTATSSLVTFVYDGRKATASFTPKGKLSYVITNCSAENLPAAFGKNIKNNYAGFQLFNAIEIKAHGETVYQAILENATAFVTLKFTSEGAEEIKQVKK